MSQFAIKLENLSKKFRLVTPQARYRTLREQLGRMARAPFKWGRATRPSVEASPQQTADDEFWALRDLNIEIAPGSVVGLIGANGAGKSTLLKILSRITEPTGGYADLQGRISSLLEVGTGFHPELSGRENIYLNGAILGMRRAEINRKFDEIVEFAGVGKFIDTPVKHYSSGMHLRLGFSVAAHLETEILLVDEVLAVGDLVFQKKCLGKMGEVASVGRTVIFVSHNMRSLRKLCHEGILLRSGQIAHTGLIDECIGQYMGAETLGPCALEFPLHPTKPAQFSAIALQGAETGSNRVRQDEDVIITGCVVFRQRLHACMVAVALWSAEGFPVFTTTDWDTSEHLRYAERAAGAHSFRIVVPRRLLFPGRYYLHLNLGLAGQCRYDKHTSSVEFEVLFDGSLMSELSDARRGVVTCALDWEWEESYTSEYALA